MATPTPTRSIDGWIVEGALVTEVKGQPLTNTSDLEAIVLTDLTPDLDGKSRTPVTVIRPGDPRAQTVNLTLPVMRKIGLSGAIEIDASCAAGYWQSQVTKGGADDSGLKAGDVLLSETSTGQFLGDPTSIETLLTTLSERGASTASFEVMRGVRRMNIELKLN